MSAAACLLGLRVRIPPGAWMSVSYERCAVTGRGLCNGPIPRTGQSYEVCVYDWVWLSATITVYTQNEQADRGQD